MQRAPWNICCYFRWWLCWVHCCCCVPPLARLCLVPGGQKHTSVSQIVTQYLRVHTASAAAAVLRLEKFQNGRYLSQLLVLTLCVNAYLSGEAAFGCLFYVYRRSRRFLPFLLLLLKPSAIWPLKSKLPASSHSNFSHLLPNSKARHVCVLPMNSQPHNHSTQSAFLKDQPQDIFVPKPT